MSKRALIYLRVSTPGQAEKENPIETQRAACLEYARKNDFTVDPVEDVYVDGGISGRTDERAAFRLMNARLEADTEVGAVISYDRSEEHTSELQTRLHHVCPL